MNYQTLSLSQLLATAKVTFPLSFGALSFLKAYSGTFTPANNQLTVVPGADLPNNGDDVLILIMADAQVNVLITTTLESPYAPCRKLFVLTLKGDAANQLASVIFDGRTTVPDPMSQGIPVNYSVIIAKGPIS